MNKDVFTLTAVVAILLIISGVIYQNYVTTPEVYVKGINLIVYQPPGTGAVIVGHVLQPSSTFTIKADSFFDYELNITNDGKVPIYVQSVTTNTTGFAIPTTYLSQSLPLEVSPGQSKTLYVTVATPSVSYSGPVNIIVKVTTSS
ncbi:MAG: hypothetical protein ACP5FU_04145 [Nitrososphaeria archaeon]|nr:hypothetical protein [Conexivisphaerales archaeon]